MRSTLFALAAASLFATAAQAAPATYAIDPTHTFATFEIDHFGASTNRARFDKKSGNVQFDKAGKTGKVDVELDMTSVNSGTAAFNKHLQSADIFDAEKFPSAKFVSDKFVFDGDKLKEVTGHLTLKGKTAPITLKANKFTATKAPCCKSVKSAAATLKPPSTAPSGAWTTASPMASPSKCAWSCRSKP